MVNHRYIDYQEETAIYKVLAVTKRDGTPRLVINALPSQGCLKESFIISQLRKWWLVSQWVELLIRNS